MVKQRISDLLAFGMLILLAMSGHAWPDCRKADELVRLAADVAYQDDPAGIKALLENALKHCPDHPEALNNMGVLVEGGGDLRLAMGYYRKALSIKPGMPEAWVGVGDVYRKQGQLPLALEAYLDACEKDEDAKERARALLMDDRFRVVETGQVLNRASLKALFDDRKFQAIAEKARACGFKLRATMRATAIFRNFLFATASAELPDSAQAQTAEIVAVLKDLKPKRIYIEGHTDSQPFKAKTQYQSDRLNRQLSRDRALTISTALQARGIESKKLRTRGFSPDRPIRHGESAADYAANRRVEIRVE